MNEVVKNKWAIDLSKISAVKAIDATTCRIYIEGNDFEVPMSYQMMMSLISSRRSFATDFTG